MEGFYIALLAQNKGEDSLIILRPPLWPLQGRGTLGVSLGGSCKNTEPNHQDRRSPKKMAQRIVGDAGIARRLVTRDKVQSNPADESRL